MKPFSFIFCLLSIISFNAKSQSSKVIQFDISKLLNGRPVSTLTGNKLTTWTKGIDGNGFGDGYLTLSAALFNGDKEPHALPDNSLIAANNAHPSIKLHYSNSDSLHKQTCNITGEGGIQFAVPQGKYKAIYLALTSAEGSSFLKMQFIYADSTASKDLLMPDYYNDIIADNPNLCYLVHDLAKWGNKNNMTEKDHHNIDLLIIHPDPNKKLKTVSIQKKKPGYLVFWAAAGEKTND
jgi:hypothetical protein